MNEEIERDMIKAVTAAESSAAESATATSDEATSAEATSAEAASAEATSAEAASAEATSAEATSAEAASAAVTSAAAVDPNTVGIIKPRRMMRTVVSLTVICLSVALLLSLVNALTKDKIADNLKTAEKNAVIEVFGYEDIEYTELDGVPEGVRNVYGVSRAGNELGWCVAVSPSGFGGNINMVVGVGKDGKIVGVAITSLSETPGLGSRVGERSYLDRYTGLGTGLKLKTDVDAITGATISSRSVLTGVNAATAALVSMGLIEGR